ncbi:DinB family protein [Chitinophaga sp. XS-30]|uniref:DinB family protein n=1 Tax=Chitinophaga sp. XS-30 TaxID=2604421 RepID=UPI0011DD1041|nr:DinB family protein [Chitinophaga sp. XS-30]QEH41223.1 DinB family protein [Chitinophaga sp. XS-30]
MEAKTASRRTEGLLALFDMHTTFFSRAIDGISEEDAYNRLNTKANHIAWLTGALVEQRYSMIQETHPELKQTGGELFKDNKGIQEGAKYPTLAEYQQDWDKVSPLAREALINASDAQLDSEIDMGFMKMSLYELMSFTIYREASIIGQLALWRRLLGYPALKYD